MAKTDATTTLGETIHTRTTGDAVESQAVVIAIDGSDAVVPAHATDGLSVKVTNSPSVFASIFDSREENLSSTVSNSDDNQTGEDAEALKVAPYMFDDSDSRFDKIRGTIANGLDVDVTRVQGNVAVTGTFWQATQPVSGTVTANLAAGTNNIGDVDVLSLPALPAGNNNIGDVDVASLPNVTLDAATLTALETITIGTALPAGNANIGDVDVASLPGTVAADIAAIKTATEVLDNAISGSEMQVDVLTMPTVTVQDGGGSISVDDGGATLTIDDGGGTISVDGTVALDAGTLTALETVTANAGTGTMATQDVRPANAGVSTVLDTASSTTLLAADANRLAAMIFNDSTETLFVKYGTTASLGSFTVKILAGGYFEFPQPVYTGRVDGIWEFNASGAARITELSA